MFFTCYKILEHKVRKVRLYIFLYTHFEILQSSLTLVQIIRLYFFITHDTQCRFQPPTNEKSSARVEDERIGRLGRSECTRDHIFFSRTSIKYTHIVQLFMSSISMQRLRQTSPVGGVTLQILDNTTNYKNCGQKSIETVQNSTYTLPIFYFPPPRHTHWKSWQNPCIDVLLDSISTPPYYNPSPGFYGSLSGKCRTLWKM